MDERHWSKQKELRVLSPREVNVAIDNVQLSGISTTLVAYDISKKGDLNMFYNLMEDGE